MDEKIERSLERMIEHLFSDEIRDWEAQGKPRNHIFTDIRRVDRWLDKEIIGKGRCDPCDEIVNVVYGPCDCDEGCKLQTWVCEKCGSGVTPD